MIDLMGGSPFDFVMNHKEYQLENLEVFVHRTFNGGDFITFIKALRNIYISHGGLETVFAKHQQGETMQQGIHEFKKVFFEIEHQNRTQKHVSDPVAGSAAKRINIFVRVISAVC
jgi:hypothetical protein